jgi:hypothetical protein
MQCILFFFLYFVEWKRSGHYQRKGHGVRGMWRGSLAASAAARRENLIAGIFLICR